MRTLKQALAHADVREYKGYLIRWYDWKFPVESRYIAGLWIAHNVDSGKWVQAAAKIHMDDTERDNLLYRAAKKAAAYMWMEKFIDANS